MEHLEDVLKRDFVYWDISKNEIVLKKEDTKPDWAYFELWKGVFEDIVTEYFKDGEKRLTFSYALNTPINMINMQRYAHFQQHKGNWTRYMVVTPVSDFEKAIKQYYFED